MATKRSLKPQMVDRVETRAPAIHAGHAGQAGHTMFTPKHCIRVGSWNVRSLGKPTRQNGRMRDVLRTMREKKIELLALAEVRWPGHGVSQLDGVVIIHSGMAESDPQCRRRGVAVILEDLQPRHGGWLVRSSPLFLKGS